MYKTHSLEEYEEVMSLRKKFGWGAKKISNFLFNKGIYIKSGAIAGWLYANKRPFKEIIINKIPKKSKFLTKEKSYILGTLCGDGYIRIQKSSHSYLVGLNVTDEDFADEFRKCLKKVYNLVPSKKFKKLKYTNYCDNPKPQYIINLTSKLVVQDLLQYLTSFKTKEWSVPNQIKNSHKIIKSYFLRGFFDSEGSISLKKKGHAHLQIYSINEKSLLIIKQILLKDFDINTNIRFTSNNVLVLSTERYKDIKNFSDKIGFTIERKSKTLELSLQSYKRKGLRRYNKNFKLKVLNILDKGYSAYKIGKILDFPYTNVYDFIKQNNKIKEKL